MNLDQNKNYLIINFCKKIWIILFWKQKSNYFFFIILNFYQLLLKDQIIYYKINNGIFKKTQKLITSIIFKNSKYSIP